jgi:hypothetical protein
VVQAVPVELYLVQHLPLVVLAATVALHFTYTEIFLLHLLIIMPLARVVAVVVAVVLHVMLVAKASLQLPTVLAAVAVAVALAAYQGLAAQSVLQEVPGEAQPEILTIIQVLAVAPVTVSGEALQV